MNKLYFSRSIQQLTNERYAYKVSADDIEFIVILPIDHRLLSIENSFRAYSGLPPQDFDLLDDIPLIYSGQFIKQYIRTRVAIESSKLGLYKTQPKRLVESINTSNVQLVKYNTLQDLCSKVHPINIAPHLLRALDSWYKDCIYNNIYTDGNLKKPMMGKVLLFNITLHGLEVCSLGTIESYRYKELFRTPIHLNSDMLENNRFVLDRY